MFSQNKTDFSMRDAILYLYADDDVWKNRKIQANIFLYILRSTFGISKITATKLNEY